MNVSVTGNSHAKIILIGEHSVVYHQPAIALPLPAVQVHAEMTANRDSQQILTSRYYSGDRQDAPIQLQGINRLIDALLAHLAQPDAGFTLTIKSDLPAERGMGSSAATAVAIVRAMYRFFNAPLSHERLLKEVAVSEKIIHGHPSGLDAATASAETPVWFIKGETPQPLPFHLNGYLVIADSGIHGQTGIAVANVAAYRKAHPKQANQAIHHLGELAQQAKVALAQNQVTHLGTILTAAQRDLKQLGVSHPVLDQMMTVTRQNGALGAKLTGGGMGGCMISLAATQADAIRIQQALSGAGFKQTWLQPFLSEETV